MLRQNFYEQNHVKNGMQLSGIHSSICQTNTFNYQENTYSLLLLAKITMEQLVHYMLLEKTIFCKIKKL